MFKLGQAQPVKYSLRFNQLFVVMVMVASILIAPIIGRAYSFTEDNITGWYAFEETTGVRADSGALGNDLTDNNSVGYTTGKIGNAASLSSASSQYLSNTNITFPDDTSFSYCGWYYPTSLSGYKSYISQTAAGADGITMWANGAGLAYYHGGIDGVDPMHTVQLNTWEFLCVTYDGTIARTYADGSAGGTKTMELTTSTADLRIGYDGSNYYSGRVDELVILDVVLTAQDITDLYNGGTGVTYTDVFPPTSTTSTSTTATSTVDVEELKWVLELYLAIFTFLIFTYIGYRFTKVFI